MYSFQQKYPWPGKSENKAFLISFDRKCHNNGMSEALITIPCAASLPKNAYLYISESQFSVVIGSTILTMARS